ncbi:MAG: NADH-quinone oxidoreductase subunit C [Streptosporangiales bacterium]|nr:NADH-quinone oxidoreductase subunit C [Streptosporangiales bacterium]
MTESSQLVAALTERFPAVECTEDQVGAVTADVPVAEWVAVASHARDQLGCTYFDWLSAVDDQDDGLVVLTHLWSIPLRRHLLLRTRLPVPAAGDRWELPSLTGVFRGAAWHERETAEMFGVVFTGHPNLTPLLLPDGFEGHPLRKDFVLASRVAKPWPGAKEPGESEHDAAPSRRRVRPPGKPDVDEWRAAAGSADTEPGSGEETP